MFYVVAENQEGKQFILSSNETDRMTAKIDIEEQAKYRMLNVNLEELRLVKGTGSQARTNTKFFRERRRTGTNGRGYDRAL